MREHLRTVYQNLIRSLDDATNTDVADLHRMCYSVHYIDNLHPQFPPHERDRARALGRARDILIQHGHPDLGTDLRAWEPLIKALGFVMGAHFTHGDSSSQSGEAAAPYDIRTMPHGQTPFLGY